MADPAGKVARKQRLRSSCDGCGAAKVKCDKGHPECRRCISLGMSCVYGVSRPMGKPPQNKHWNPETSSSTTQRVREEDASNAHGPISATGRVAPPHRGSMAPGFGEFSISGGGTPMADDPGGFMAMRYGDPSQGSPLASSSFDLTATDFGWPALGHHSPYGPCNEPQSYRVDDYGRIEDTPASTGSTNKSHDCCREALACLSGLAFLDLDRARDMPLEHIIRLNRESCERLSRVLACECAKRSHLALLCASIIARALLVYQQAAWNTQRRSLGISPGGMAHYLRPSSSLSDPLSPVSSSATGGTNTGNMNTPLSTTSSSVSGMSIGSLHVDDQQVQVALRIQLLLGEIRRAGALVDLFASHNTASVDEFTFNSADALHRSLTLWLRREYTRVVDLTHSRLLEAST